MGLEMTKTQALLLQMKEEGRSVEKLDMRFAPYFNSGKQARVRFPDGKMAQGQVACWLYQGAWPMFAIEVPHGLSSSVKGAVSETEVTYVHLYVDQKCVILPTMEELDEVVELGDQTEADWTDTNDPKKAYWQSITSGRMAMMELLGGTISDDQSEMVDAFVKESVSRGMVLRDLPKDSLKGLWHAFQKKVTGSSTQWVTPSLAPHYNRVKASGASDDPDPEFVSALGKYCEDWDTAAGDLTFPWIRRIYEAWSNGKTVAKTVHEVFAGHILSCTVSATGGDEYALHYRWLDEKSFTREYTWNIRGIHRRLWTRCQHLLGTADVPYPPDLMDLITYSVQSVDDGPIAIVGFRVPELVDRWLTWKMDCEAALKYPGLPDIESADYGPVAFYRRPLGKLGGPYEIVVTHDLKGVQKSISVFLDRRVLSMFYHAMSLDLYRSTYHPGKFLNWCRLVTNTLGAGVTNYTAIPKATLEEWLAEFDGGMMFAKIHEYAKAWTSGTGNPSNPFPGDSSTVPSWVHTVSGWTWKEALDWPTNGPAVDREVRLIRSMKSIRMYSDNLANWYGADELNEGSDPDVAVLPPSAQEAAAKIAEFSQAHKKILDSIFEMPPIVGKPKYVPGKVSGTMKVKLEKIGGVKPDFISLDDVSFDNDDEPEPEPGPKKGRLIDL